MGLPDVPVDPGGLDRAAAKSISQYRGFWPEYWWVCVGSLVLPAVWAWLTWTPPNRSPDKIMSDTSCEGIKHPAPGYCELHTRR